MNTKEHVIIGGVVCMVLILLTNMNYTGIGIIFLINILIDTDHIFGVWVSKRKIELDLKKIYKGCITLPEGPLTIFHTAEFVLLLTLISFMFSYYFVVIGAVIHLLTDYIDIPGRMGAHGRFWFSYLLARNRKF